MSWHPYRELDRYIPMETSKGKGWAIAVLDYGQEHHLIWVVALDNQQIWCVPNTEVRIVQNWTMERRSPSPPD